MWLTHLWSQVAVHLEYNLFIVILLRTGTEDIVAAPLCWKGGWGVRGGQQWGAGRNWSVAYGLPLF